MTYEEMMALRNQANELLGRRLIYPIPLLGNTNCQFIQIMNAVSIGEPNNVASYSIYGKLRYTFLGIQMTKNITLRQIVDRLV